MTTGFVPLWHPPEGGHAGGFVRAKHILEGQRRYDLAVVDSDRTDLDARCIRGTLTLIPERRLFAKRPVCFAILRGLNWLWHATAATFVGLSTDRKVDFVYVPYSEMLTVSLPGFLVAKIRRVPLVFCNLNVRGVAFWAINRWLHDRSDLIITLSAALRDEIQSQGITRPVRIGGVGVYDGSLPNAGPIYDGIFVARHTVEKGAFDLLEIWEACCRSNSALRLVMVGPCDSATKRRIDADLSRRGLENNVILFGQVSEAEKWRLFSVSRVCLFPSHVEGWGIVPVEAHLAGLPVVAYDLGAYRETIADSPASTLVSLDDKASFARAVLAYLDIGIDSAAAREWAAKFSWKAAVELEISLIESILGPESG